MATPSCHINHSSPGIQQLGGPEAMLKCSCYSSIVWRCYSSIVVWDGLTSNAATGTCSTVSGSILHEL